MESEETAEQTERRQPPPEIAQKLVGWIISAILVYFAQRDLRKRPAELVRGRVLIWRIAAATPLGAVVYLLFGRRKAGQAMSEAAGAMAA